MKPHVEVRAFVTEVSAYESKHKWGRLRAVTKALFFIVASVLLSPAGAAAQPAGPQACPPGWYCEPAAPPIAEPKKIRLPEVPAPPTAKPWEHFGFGARLALPLVSRSAAAKDGALGAGVAFRYRPARSLALEAAVDGFLGYDFKGDFRKEAAYSATALLTPDVRRRVRPTLLAGLFLGQARVDPDAATDAARSYAYLGLSLGFGLELRLSRRLAFHSELVGFVRERVDPGKNKKPEYVDPGTGRATNTSGGGLLRAGVVALF